MRGAGRWPAEGAALGGDERPHSERDVRVEAVFAEDAEGDRNPLGHVFLFAKERQVFDESRVEICTIFLKSDQSRGQLEGYKVSSVTEYSRFNIKFT